jgi:preprotein translocase subunit Sss1
MFMQAKPLEISKRVAAETMFPPRHEFQSILVIAAIGRDNGRATCPPPF